ncbi:hypothetical protein DITRI_Ditri20bG0040400 [Diplodiscus trichospermus]
MSCFLSQDHKLSFINFRHRTGEHMKCGICRQPIRGPTYTCDNCGYKIHESCFGFPREIQLPIFQVSPLHPIVNASSFCCACGGVAYFPDIAYRCRDRQSERYFRFHLHCANSLRRAIKVDSHEHPLFYFGTECQKLFSITEVGLAEIL